MISPKELLEVSTSQIKDKSNLVLLCPYKRFRTLTGYSFITLIRRKTRSISASVELNVSWERDEDLGFLKEVNCSINTQEKISGNYCILYQDVIIFLNDFISYTESMGQYQYNGRAISVDKLMLIDSKNENNIYGYSCLDLLCQYDDYNVFPEYIALSEKDVKEGCFLIKIEDSESISMISNNQNRMEQVRKDTVSIRCLNVTRDEIMKFLYGLLDFGRTNDIFGLVGDYQIKEINNYDDYSNLRGIRFGITLNICYNINAINELDFKKISVIKFKIKEA